MIKTLPNPHNNVRMQLAALPEALQRRITHIDGSLSGGELNELFNSANVVVLPSRGEGFNLPAAEAMAMGIPVIVTGFGGHTDFATTSTAWLIDYAFAPAVTHLSVPGSCWVEPRQPTCRS